MLGIFSLPINPPPNGYKLTNTQQQAKENITVADKKFQKAGPSKVEQGKNANEMIHPADDIPEARPAQDPVEITQDDLDRGEELYTGFGFGGAEIKEVANTAVPEPANNKTTQADRPDTKNIIITTEKTTDKDPIEPATPDPQTPERLTADYTEKAVDPVVTPAPEHPDDKPVKAEKITTPTPRKEETTPAPSTNKTIEPAPPIIVGETQTKTPEKREEKVTVTHTTTNSTNTEKNYVPSTPNHPHPGESFKEEIDVPAEKRIIIEPHDGEVEYYEHNLLRRKNDQSIVEKTHTNRENRESIDLTTAIAYDRQTPADYELAGVHYDRDGRGEVNRINTAYNNLAVLPIKKHYQAKEKQTAPEIPWKAIGIGAAIAVALGASYYLLTDDDDGWF